MRRASDMLSIGRIAERTGMAVSAIRFYEAEGLVRPIRTAAGQRQFRRSDIRRLSFVKIAQELGFSLAEIREEGEISDAAWDLAIEEAKDRLERHG